MMRRRRAASTSCASAGFCFVHADAMRTTLGGFGGVGRLGDVRGELGCSSGPIRISREPGVRGVGGMRVFRRRRDGALTRAPHQPHFQTPCVQRAAGRHRPLVRTDPDRAVGDSALVAGDAAVLRAASSVRWRRMWRAWRIEVHQFRIEARPRCGRGADAGRRASGRCRFRARADGRSAQHRERDDDDPRWRMDGLLGSFTFADALDAALVDDARVFHGVTAVTPLIPSDAGASGRAGGDAQAR